MLEKTKELFNAPWKVSLHFIVKDNNNRVVVSGCNEEDNNRIARLPELYDTLLEAAYEHCHSCVELDSENEYVPPSSDFIKYGCPKKSKRCFCRRWWDVLRKVEAGE